MPAKRGWGHSTIDDVLRLGQKAVTPHSRCFFSPRPRARRRRHRRSGHARRRVAALRMPHGTLVTARTTRRYREFQWTSRKPRRLASGDRSHEVRAASETTFRVRSDDDERLRSPLTSCRFDQDPLEDLHAFDRFPRPQLGLPQRDPRPPSMRFVRVEAGSAPPRAGASSGGRAARHRGVDLPGATRPLLLLAWALADGVDL